MQRRTDQKQVCANYSKGKCKFGERCRDEHIGDIPQTVQPFTPKPSNKICSFYLENKCTNGNNCRFQHPQDQSQNQQSPQPPKTPQPRQSPQTQPQEEQKVQDQDQDLKQDHLLIDSITKSQVYQRECIFSIEDFLNYKDTSQYQKISIVKKFDIAKYLQHQVLSFLNKYIQIKRFNELFLIRNQFDKSYQTQQQKQQLQEKINQLEQRLKKFNNHIQNNDSSLESIKNFIANTFESFMMPCHNYYLNDKCNDQDCQFSHKYKTNEINRLCYNCSCNICYKFYSVSKSTQNSYEINGLLIKSIFTKEIRIKKERLLQILQKRNNMVLDLGFQQSQEEYENDNLELQKIQDSLRQIYQNAEVFINQVKQFDQELNDKKINKYLYYQKYNIEKSLLQKGLPSYQKKIDILRAVQNQNTNNKFVLIQGETGSGKSTQIPQYLFQNLRSKRTLICIQPRKVSAISIADFISKSMGFTLGKEVGYLVGKNENDQNYELGVTRILFMTEQSFQNYAIKDMNQIKEGKEKSVLSYVDYIILDEIHERTLTGDIIMTLMKQIISQQHTQIKFIMMSATVNEELFLNYLNNCQFLKIPGRTYPIEYKYRPCEQEINYQKHQIYQIFQEIQTQIQNNNINYMGHILIFMNDMKEIGEVIESIENNCPFIKNGIISNNGQKFEFILLPLHGKLDQEQQQQVFEKQNDNVIKIVVATKIAECSITIDGVKIVIDSGYDKDAFYDSKKKVNIINVQRITQSAAKQRAGRAGRTNNGICYRLYSQEQYDQMQVDKIPDIQKGNLDLCILKLKQFGITNTIKFFNYFIQPPDEQNVQNSHNSLSYLQAIDNNGNITDFGRISLELEIDPVLVKMIIEGKRRGVGEQIAKIYSVQCFSGIVFRKPTDKQHEKNINLEKSNYIYHYQNRPVQSDHLMYLNIYDQIIEKNQKKDYLNGGVLKRIKNQKKQLEGLLKKIDLNQKYQNYIAPQDKYKNDPEHISILKSIFAAYYNSISEYSGNNFLGYCNFFYDTCFQIHNISALKLDGMFIQPDDLIIYTELASFNGNNIASNISKINREWIKDSSILNDNQLQVISQVGTQKKFVQKDFKHSQAVIMHIIYYLRQQIFEILEEFSQKQNGNRSQKAYIVFLPENFSITIFYSQQSQQQVDQFQLILKIQKIIDIAVLEAKKKREFIEYKQTGIYANIKQGMTLEELIYKDQFAKIYIQNIPSECSREEILQSLNIDYQNEIVYDTFNINSKKNQIQKEKKQGLLCLKNVQIAEKLICKQNQTIIRNTPVEMQKRHFQCEKNMYQSFKIKAKWCTGDFTGTVEVVYENDSNSDLALNIFQNKANIYVRGNQIKIKNYKNKLIFSNFPLDFTEQEMTPILADSNNIVPYSYIELQRTPNEDWYMGNPDNLGAIELQQRREYQTMLLVSNFTQFLSPEEMQHLDIQIQGEKKKFTNQATILLGSMDKAQQIVQNLDNSLNIIGTHRVSLKIQTKKSILIDSELYSFYQKKLNKAKIHLNNSHKTVQIFLNHNKNNKDKAKLSKITVDSQDEREQAQCINYLNAIINGVDIQEKLNKEQLSTFIQFIPKLRSGPFKQFLNEIKHKNKNQVLIRLNKANNSLILHGDENNFLVVVQYIYEFIKEFVQNEITHKYQFKIYSNNKVQSILKQFDIEYRVNLRQKQIEVIGMINDHVKEKIDQEAKMIQNNQQECIICFGDANYMLEECKHHYCITCLQELIVQNQENIKCCDEECNKEILLIDINFILGGGEYIQLLQKKTAKQIPTIKNPLNQERKYIDCQTPDCPYVFEAFKRNTTERQQMLICELCFAKYCNLNNEKNLHDVHPTSISCEKYLQTQENPLCDLDDQFFQCPKCKQGYEKTGGCKHMACIAPGCGNHFCSVCKASFDNSNDCYTHLNQQHGGFF